MKMKITMGNRDWRGKRAILGNTSCNWGNFDKLDIVEFPYILPTSNRSGKSAFYRTTLPFWPTGMMVSFPAVVAALRKCVLFYPW